jgi:hypothetical protein
VIKMSLDIKHFLLQGLKQIWYQNILCKGVMKWSNSIKKRNHLWDALLIRLPIKILDLSWIFKVRLFNVIGMHIIAICLSNTHRKKSKYLLLTVTDIVKVVCKRKTWSSCRFLNKSFSNSLPFVYKFLAKKHEFYDFEKCYFGTIQGFQSFWFVKIKA